MWVATSAGLRRGERAGTEWTWTAVEPLATEGISALALAHDGATWAGIDRGLVRFDPASDAAAAGPSPDRSWIDGLTPEAIRALVVDPAGRLWIRSFNQGAEGAGERRARRGRAANVLAASRGNRRGSLRAFRWNVIVDS